ncbi:MAG: ABC-F family ATP-binding cassette domain-containing protein [Gemmatimonadetes bacterium]|nr:ABC-F family ATP-binding cassette domain-containing protein [Gemmatimonadota bacterium]
MNVLNISGLWKGYGGRSLFEGVSANIGDGEKIGFIGVNGSGKSTLFRIAAGLESQDAGEVALRRGACVRYLAQEPEFSPGQSIRAAAAEGRPDRLQALAEYDVIARRLAVASPDHDRLLHRQAELAATIERLGGWDWMHRVEAMLTRLGVSGWDRPVAGLSGGEAKRVALARTLLAEPDLLLLDEPTNHLDADTVLWLEEYLIEFRGALMLVTHDRYFLDRVVDRIVEVARGELTPYPGGYTEYLEAQAERAERQALLDARRRKLIAQELEWAKRSPPARTGKQRARSKRAQALAEESRACRARQTRELVLQTASAGRLGRTVLELEGVSKSFGERVLIRDLSTRLRAGERVGSIGPNGAGKTTLVRMIMGEVPADRGAIRIGGNSRLACFDQPTPAGRGALSPEQSVYDAVGGKDWVEVGGRRLHLRTYLEDFLFPVAQQQQLVSSLSGGERNRLALAKLFLQPANILVLDEPTNDLDIVTLQVLEAALADYRGCVLMVTHDRFFLDKIATALLVFEGDGVVHRHEGGFELYRVLRERRDAEQAAAEQEVARRRPAKPPAARPAPEVGAARKLTWKEQREREGMEQLIVAAEAERERLAARLLDPGLYQDRAEAARASADFEAAEAAVEALYARWAELEERAASS